MKIGSAVCYSLNLPSRDPMAYLRLIGPFQTAGIRLIDGIVDGRAEIERISLGEVVVIQRHFPREFAAYVRIVQTAKRQRKPVVFDIDDLLFSLPDTHPDRRAQHYATSLLPMYQALSDADLVTVSTPQLCEVLSKYNKNIAVLPNYFEDLLWHFAVPKLKAEATDVVSVGFMGGQSHEPDLEYVAPALLELVKARPNRVSFHFWGAEPPASLRSLGNIAWTPFRLSSYEDFATYFQTQTADIFIAPLTDTLFNRCKSPLKFFEYSALGVPGVYSRLTPYQQVVSHGKNGLLAGSLREWADCLIQLVDDVELRHFLPTNAQATIEAGWLASRNAHRWGETYGRLAGESVAEMDWSADITGSMNAQVAEAFADREAKTEALALQVQDRDATVEMLGRQLGERNCRIDALDAQLAKQNVQAIDLCRQLAEQGAAVESLKAEVLEHGRQNGALHRHLAERDAQVESLSRSLADRDAQVESLSRSLADRDAQVESLSRSLADRDSKVSELDARLRAILSSKAWRAGVAARRAGEFFLGLRRRRLSAIRRAYAFARGRLAARTWGKGSG
jgi:glycosyltransferase involved in cell wall biosynthesis/uncharacterized coiled-coil protein SlyX